MDDSQYIWAYTPGHDQHEYKSYPPFVNLSRKGGRFVLTMRAHEDLSGQHPNVGAGTELVIPDDEVARLRESLKSPDQGSK